MLSDDNHSLKCSDVKIKPYLPRWKVNKNYFYHWQWLFWNAFFNVIHVHMDEFVVYMKLFWLPCMIFLNCMIIFLPYPSLSPSSVYSLSLSSKYPSIFLSLFLSVKYFSFSLSPLFSDCTQTWLAFHLFCEHLFTKTYTFSNKNLNVSMKCKLLISPLCKNQDG